MARVKRLSEKSMVVLGRIAEGHSYGQIVDGHPDISYLDIFKAAEEALVLNESQSTGHQERIEKIKRHYPRAWERWEDEEDARLVALHEQGQTTAEIARQLERQPSAIRSRLTKLDLTE